MGFPTIPPLQPQLPLFPQHSQPQPQQQQQQQRTGQQSPVQFPAGAAPPPMFYYPVQAAPSGGFPPAAGFQVGPPAGAPPGSTAGPSSAARQPQPYQPFSVPPTTAQNVQPAFSPFASPPTQPQPPSSQQTAQQHRFPAAYFTSQSLPHAQPVQFQQQQQQQPVQAQYPAQQYYAVPQQLTPQYQAFLQRYQNLQQNQNFSQYPQILQKTPSQQSLLRPGAGLLPQEPPTAAAVEREKEKAQAERRVRDQQQQQRQQQKEREPEKPIYSEYCEGWLFVCERPSVRFLKSWVVLKEAGLHLSDGPSSRARLVIPLTRVKAFLVDAQKNTGKKHSFGLQLKDDKIYYFAARGAEDLLPWLQSVRKELRRMAETSPSAVKEIVPTAPATPATAPDTTKPKERSKREKREKKSTPEKSKEGKPKDRNGTFSGLFAKLSSMAAGSGDDKVYKLLDEEFLKQMKEDGAAEEDKSPTQQQLDSQKVIIFSHMNKVFSLYSHPLGKLVIDFTDEFLRHKDRILSARPSTALAKITQEIQTFLDRLIITVEHYYGGEVAHVEQFVHTARLAAEHCVFSLLYDIVYPVYTKRYIAEDRKFTQKMAEFADITTPDLIDNPKFWLLDDKKGGEGRSGGEPYQKAINMMTAITELATPVAKLNCLVDTSRIICGCVNEYWAKRDPTGPEIAVSCDDLLPILLYVVIKSKLETVHTESMYMQDFIGEREQMQIEGYSLATFQAASAALLCLERDSLRKPEEAVAPTTRPTGASSSVPSGPATPASPTTPPNSSATQPSADASSALPTSPEASVAPPAAGGSQSRLHRARRASWISSVLAQQAAIPLQPDGYSGDAATATAAGDGQEEEEDDDWTFFKSGAAAAAAASPALMRRPSSAEDEEFIDSFRPPTSTSTSSASATGTGLLIDWGSDSDTKQEKEDGEGEEAAAEEGVEELGSDDPTTSDGEEPKEEGAHPASREEDEAATGR